MRKFLLLITLLLFAGRNLPAQASHIFYAGGYGPNYYNYFEREGYWSLNYRLVNLNNDQLTHFYIGTGWGACRSNLDNLQHYFPSQIGVMVGKEHIYGLAGFASTPVWGAFQYEEDRVFNPGVFYKRKSFTVIHSALIHFNYITDLGVFIQMGFGWRFMPDDYAAYANYVMVNPFVFSFGAGYRFMSAKAQ